METESRLISYLGRIRIKCRRWSEIESGAYKAHLNVLERRRKTFAIRPSCTPLICKSARKHWAVVVTVCVMWRHQTTNNLTVLFPGTGSSSAEPAREKKSKLRQASLPLLCSVGADYIHTDTWCTNRKSQRCRAKKWCDREPDFLIGPVSLVITVTYNLSQNDVQEFTEQFHVHHSVHHHRRPANLSLQPHSLRGVSRPFSRRKFNQWWWELFHLWPAVISLCDRWWFLGEFWS